MKHTRFLTGLVVNNLVLFQGFPLFVGIKNSSMGGGVDMAVGGAANMVKDLMTASIDDDSDDDDNLLGVLEYIARSINAR